MPFGLRQTPLVKPIYHVGPKLNEVLRKTRNDAEKVTHRRYAVIATNNGYFLRTPRKDDVRIDLMTDNHPNQPLFIARVDKRILFNKKCLRTRSIQRKLRGTPPIFPKRVHSL